MEGFTSKRQWKNFNLHTRRRRSRYWATLSSPWRPSGGPGERPRGYEEAGGGRRAEGGTERGGARRQGGRGEGGRQRGGGDKHERKEVEKEVACGEKQQKKKKRREGDGARGQGRQLEGRWGLSAFDVKSLRQKRSGAECCSTCSGNSQWRRQHGDGEDEGAEIKSVGGGGQTRRRENVEVTGNTTVGDIGREREKVAILTKT